MNNIPNLIHSKYYHIYNCGINGAPLFTEQSNYEYFMGLYQKHITPIADTFAWGLMGNHFHLLVRINDVDVNDRNQTGFENLSGFIDNNNNTAKPPHQCFSNLFNAYSKAFNKRFNRHGALFERPFKRKLVEDESYLKNLVLYIHNNPVHHGFTNHPLEYTWSSYFDVISKDDTFIKRNQVIEWFDDVENFKYMHENKSIDTIEMEKYLGL